MEDLYVSVDKSGRIVLPKEVRTTAGARAGDLYDIQVIGRQIHLLPRESKKAGLREVNGRLVWSAPEADVISSDEVQELIRKTYRERE